MSTPIEELRAAAARLRDNRNCDGHRVDCNSRELLEMIRVLLRAREPLAAWLEHEITRYDPAADIQVTDRSHEIALTVARAINGAAEPGPGGDGRIADRLSGSSLYEQLRRAAGEAP
ncbi:hypothetical protein WB388_08830 [Streptomyces brasiliscabiei]|uniref:AbiTii domain-containing protein n=1 Tax=Streptomyces brasiliscabiei TaxID=2736302 RepID=A0ABU8G9V7_9ACTN